MNSKATDFDLDQYVSDFAQLQALEGDAEADWERVGGLDRWVPTDYECRYLPGLRLAGIRDKQRVIVQNTADLHLHTEWSYGDNLDRVLEQAVAMGLDAIAVTDHDEVGGAIEARRRVHQRRLPLAVVPGTEVSSRDGHIGALFVTRNIPRDLDALQTVDLIHAAGGLAVAHHPFSPWWIDRILGIKLGCGDLIRSVPFDAVECTNAVPGQGVKYNMAAIDAMRKAHITVAVTGSSDAHQAIFVGKGKTYYAGNQGVVSLRLSLELGFTRGAEGYWKTREKLRYYTHLVRSVARNALGHFGSVN